MRSWEVVQCRTPGSTSFMTRDLLARGWRRLSRRTRGSSTVGALISDVDQALALYAAGFFPMDDPDKAFAPLSFYAADDRALFELDARTRGNVRRRVRRSLRAGAGWALRIDTAFETVLAAWAAPRPARPGGGGAPRPAAAPPPPPPRRAP